MEIFISINFIQFLFEIISKCFIILNYKMYKLVLYFYTRTNKSISIPMDINNLKMFIR